MSEITNVYLWHNGMVMVFDEHGQQMPDYQGPLEEIQQRLLRDAPATARFHGGIWRRGTVQIGREGFDGRMEGGKEGRE